MFYEILSANVFLLLFVVIKTKMGMGFFMIHFPHSLSFFTPEFRTDWLFHFSKVNLHLSLQCLFGGFITVHFTPSFQQVRFSVQVNVNVVCLTIKLYLMVCLVRGLKTRENFLWMNLRIKLHIELIHKNFPPFLSINQTYPSNYKLSYFQMFYVCLLKL